MYDNVWESNNSETKMETQKTTESCKRGVCATVCMCMSVPICVHFTVTKKTTTPPSSPQKFHAFHSSSKKQIVCKHLDLLFRLAMRITECVRRKQSAIQMVCTGESKDLRLGLSCWGLHQDFPAPRRPTVFSNGRVGYQEDRWGSQ